MAGPNAREGKVKSRQKRRGCSPHKRECSRLSRKRREGHDSQIIFPVESDELNDDGLCGGWERVRKLRSSPLRPRLDTDLSDPKFFCSSEPVVSTGRASGRACVRVWKKGKGEVCE